MLPINNKSPLSPRILELLTPNQNQNENNVQSIENNSSSAPPSNITLPSEILEIIFYYATLSEKKAVFPPWGEGMEKEVCHYHVLGAIGEPTLIANQYPRKNIHQLTTLMLLNKKALAEINGILTRKENQQSNWIVKQMEFCHKNIRACLINYHDNNKRFYYWAMEILNKVQHVAVTMKKFQDVPDEHSDYADDVARANNSKNLLTLLDILSSKKDIQTLNIATSFRSPRIIYNENYYSDDYDYDPFPSSDARVYYGRDIICLPSLTPEYVDDINFLSSNINSGNNIDSDILIEKIISILNGNQMLNKVTLSLKDCVISADKIEKLMMQLLDKDISELAFNNIHIEDDAAEILSSYIANMKLNELRISSAKISDIGLGYLNKVWPATLRKLSLQSNDFSEYGAKILLDTLKDSAVTEVDLRGIDLPEYLINYNKNLNRGENDNRSPIDLYISKVETESELESD